jgi:hypothetical protein
MAACLLYASLRQRQNCKTGGGMEWQENTKIIRLTECTSLRVKTPGFHDDALTTGG